MLERTCLTVCTCSPCFDESPHRLNIPTPSYNSHTESEPNYVKGDHTSWPLCGYAGVHHLALGVCTDTRRWEEPSLFPAFVSLNTGRMRYLPSSYRARFKNNQQKTKTHVPPPKKSSLMRGATLLGTPPFNNTHNTMFVTDVVSPSQAPGGKKINLYLDRGSKSQPSHS